MTETEHGLHKFAKISGEPLLLKKSQGMLSELPVIVGGTQP
jgi:hypothetical protein